MSDNNDHKKKNMHEYQKLNFNSMLVLCMAIACVTLTIVYGLYVISIKNTSLEELSAMQQLIVPFITGVLGFASGYVSAVYGFKTAVDKDVTKV